MLLFVFLRIELVDIRTYLGQKKFLITLSSSRKTQIVYAIYIYIYISLGGGACKAKSKRGGLQILFMFILK